MSTVPTPRVLPRFTKRLLLAALLVLAADDFWLIEAMILLLALFPLLLALVLVFLFKRTWVRPVLYSMGFCLASLVGITLEHWLQQALTTQRAVRVAAAITRFHAAKRHYPDSLPQLVPTYLPTVPLTSFGLWHPVPFYYHNEDSSFYLGYQQDTGLSCVRAYYDPKDGTWDYGE